MSTDDEFHIGISIARVVKFVRFLPKTAARPMHGGSFSHQLQENLDFSELAAFCMSIRRCKFDTEEVKSYGNKKGFTDHAFLSCHECHHRLFSVYCTLDDDGRTPRFQIAYVEGCEHSDKLWQIRKATDERKHWYFIDCSAARN
jgi:hypothetical protein